MQIISSNNRIITSNSRYKFRVEPEAYNLLKAGSFTASDDIWAAHRFVQITKEGDVYNSFKAAYLFLGSTAATHKWNLIDPRDLDDAYRLAFAGGITHSATGARPDGTTGYADTKLPPTALGSEIHLSYYSRTNSAYGTSVSMGVLATQLPVERLLNLYCLRANGVSSFYSSRLNIRSVAAFSSNNSLGLHIGNNILGYGQLYIRGIKVNEQIDSIQANSESPNFPIYLFARNQPYAGIGNYDNKECAFASIGNGLTDAKALILNQAVQEVQQIKNRAV